MRTKLITMVPPVANAATNLSTKNNPNHGTNPALVPQITLIVTAATNGFRRPKRSEKYPKTMLPKSMPSMVTVWARFAR